MKRMLLIVLLAGCLLLPVLPTDVDGAESKGYTITTYPKWVKVDKRSRVGAGEESHYFRKDRVLAVTVKDPGNVAVFLEDDVEFTFEFVSGSVAREFAQNLISSL